MTAIERKRAAKGISHRELCERAPLHPSNWYFLRSGQQQPRASTLARLEAALNGVSPRRVGSNAVILAVVKAAECVLALESGHSKRLIVACSVRRARKRVPQAVAPGRLRRLAIYLTAVELLVGNAELARALGCSRQNIKQARDDVEELRADAQVDAMLERCRACLRGEAG